MTISKKEVEHLAKLARIELSPVEVKMYQAQLSSIIDYVDQLKEIKLPDKNLKTLSALAENVTRKDEIKPFLKQEKLLSEAPDRKDNYYKIKSVFQ